ncbi:TolC family protein [Prosthecochloris sp. N3]|uniref:TolC family protein n=1 Tax=Prosthecochloris ethylica TaxID=2743976 RepID=A0ABR9XNY1_9CHLB|nr:TolC family protein [Prosthecochloris ethylica]MBF0585808.1 TolC family protein [Prosthecochloris ethylica]MBF0635718.1 TolC family protein [Prosthecochloris ethylica]NUK47016.1 TolC family protein [Prosthecochloris ethylica]
MKALACLVILLAISLPAAGRAEPARRLDLEEFIRLATTRNSVFEEILLDELRLRHRTTLELPADELLLSLKADHRFVLDNNDSAPGCSIELDKLFPVTATRLSASYSLDNSRTENRESSEFTLSFIQPVARNAFGRGDRLIRQLTGMENDITRYEVIEAYEDYLAGLINLYFDWYGAAENLATAETALKETTKQLENIRERARSLIARPIDVNKVRVQAAGRQENLIEIRNTYSSITELIRQAVRDTAGTDILPVRPSLAGIDTSGTGPTAERFMKTARTTMILKLLEEKAGVEVSRKAEALLPSVNLSAGYTISGEGAVMNDADPSLFAGISLDVPLPGRQDRAEWELSRIDSIETSLSVHNSMLSIDTAIRNLYRSIRNQYRLISLARDKITISRSIAADENRNYSLGKTDLSDLIDELNRLEEHRFSLITKEIELQKMLVEWRRLTDSLVRRAEKVASAPESLPAVTVPDLLQ